MINTLCFHMDKSDNVQQEKTHLIGKKKIRYIITISRIWYNTFLGGSEVVMTNPIRKKRKPYIFDMHAILVFSHVTLI